MRKSKVQNAECKVQSAKSAIRFPPSAVRYPLSAMSYLLSPICYLLLAVSFASALPLCRDSMPNGLIVLTYEDHRLPMAVLALVCRSGSASDPLDKGGLATITASLMIRGTKNMSGDSVTSIIEHLGGDFRASADRDYSLVRLQVLAKDINQGLDLLADAALNPAFAAREFAIERDRTVSSLRRIYDTPTSLARYEFLKSLFPGHPYGHSSLGDTISVAALRPEDCAGSHKAHFLPNNCFLVAVGDVKQEWLLEQVRLRFGDWQPGSAPELKATPPQVPDRLRVKVISRPDARQTVIEFGHPGIAVSTPDLLPLRLANYILGGSALASRLGQNVREKSGLAYDVRCWFDEDKLPGAFHVTVQTTKPKEAIAKMFSEIQFMHDSGALRHELDDAQSYFTGSFPLGLSSSRGKLSNIIEIELNGWGLNWLDQYPDKIRAVTLDQVNRACREHLLPGKYVMVVVGNVKQEDLGLDDVEWIE